MIKLNFVFLLLNQSIMNHFLSTFLCLLIGISLNSQIRLTDFVSEGNNKDHYLRSYQGDNYFMTVDQSNLLEVYKLQNEDTKKFLHSQVFQGLYESGINIEFKDNYMVFATVGEIVDYDFVNNEVNAARLPEDYYFSSFTGLINSTENRFPVSIKNLDQDFRGIIYELGGTIYELGEKTAFRLYKDDFFGRKYNQDNTYSIYFKNYITDQIDTVGYNVPFYQYPAQVGDSIYYFDKEGQVNKFDQMSRTSSAVPNVKLEHFGLTNCIMVDSNYLILISSSMDNSFIQVYNRETLDLINTYEFALEDFIFASQVKISGSTLTALVDRDLFIVDLETGGNITRRTNFYWTSSFEIVENRYIINPRLLSNAIGDMEFELIDLHNLSVVKIEGKFDISDLYSIGYAKFDQTYLAVFKYDDRAHNALFNIDLSSNIADTNEQLDQSNSGLSSESSVFKVNDNIYLVGPELYKIKNNNLESIYSLDKIQKVNYSYLNIHDDKIVFVNNSPKAILSYDGEVLVEEADLSNFVGSFHSNTIENYALADDFVIFREIFGKSYKYDKNTKEIIPLAESNVTDIFSYKNNVLYVEGNNLYLTNGNTTKVILDNYSGDLILSTNSRLIFKDQLIVNTLDGVVRINDDGSVTPIGGGFDPNWLKPFTTDRSGNNLIAGGRVNKLHYDGSTAFRFQLEYGGGFTVNESSDKVFFFNERNSEIKTNTFFNSETLEYGKLPEEVQDYVVVDYFENNGEGFLIMRSGFNPYDKLYIFRTDDSFLKWT